MNMSDSDLPNEMSEARDALADVTPQQWAEALRSGEYQQCHAALARDGGYCCLGVLAKLAGHDPAADYDAAIPVAYNHEWLSDHGLPVTTTFWGWNDGVPGASLSFSEIADKIDEALAS